MDRIGVVSSGSLAVFSSTYDDILISWFVWIRPERPRDDLIVLERRSRDGYGGGGSVITTSQASAGSGGGAGNESGAAMGGQTGQTCQGCGSDQVVRRLSEDPKTRLCHLW